MDEDGDDKSSTGVNGVQANVQLHGPKSVAVVWEQ